MLRRGGKKWEGESSWGGAQGTVTVVRLGER